MRLTSLAFAAVTALSMAACATAPDMPAGPPNLVRAAGEPAPPHARFYADCIAASAAAGAYVKEPGEDHLRFTCTGAPAHAFYDALATRSARVGSEYVIEDRTHRFSNRLIASTIGVDDCSTDGVGDYSCTVVLNVGEFLSD